MQFPEWASLVPDEVVYDVGFTSKRWITQSVRLEGEAPNSEFVIQVDKWEPDPKHPDRKVHASGGYTIRCSSTQVKSAEVGEIGVACPVIDFEMADVVAQVAHPPAASTSPVTPLFYFNDEATAEQVRDMMLTTP
jgi:hypothetical protein